MWYKCEALWFRNGGFHMEVWGSGTEGCVATLRPAPSNQSALRTVGGPTNHTLPRRSRNPISVSPLERWRDPQRHSQSASRRTENKEKNHKFLWFFSFWLINLVWGSTTRWVGTVCCDSCSSVVFNLCVSNSVLYWLHKPCVKCHPMTSYLHAKNPFVQTISIGWFWCHENRFAAWGKLRKSVTLLIYYYLGKPIRISNIRQHHKMHHPK